MENNELQAIWKSISTSITLNSKEELSLLLKSKINKTMRKFYLSTTVSIVICIGFTTFLTITALNRSNDIAYVFNNLFIETITLISLTCSIWTLFKLKNDTKSQPLKVWVEERIAWLSKWISNKTVYFILPILAIPSILSIHVYYEHKTLVEVIHDEESIYGLLFGLLIGLLAAYYGMSKIRKYHRKNLESLKALHREMENPGQ